MRLQSAIFTLDDALLSPAALAERDALDKALSLFKMEGVWLGAVTAQDDAAAQAALAACGLAPYFRFVLTERVALCPAESETMFRRAMKRLHGTKDDTVVFTASLAALRGAREAGLRTVAVRLGADEETWRALCAAATQSLSSYAELLG